MDDQKNNVNGNKSRRLITVKDVARELNISTMTVSRVLNNKPNVSQETRDKVTQTAIRLGYIPNHIARSLVTRKTYTIGVIVPEITHSFFPDVIRGIEEVIYNTGYNLLFIHSAEEVKREEEAIRTLEAKQVDGILISTAQNVKDHSLYRRVIENGRPFLFFDRYVNRLGASCVGIDDVGSARNITGHLIKHGYKKIAHLAGPKNVLIGRNRLRGFIKSLDEHGLRKYNELIVESGFHEMGGYDAMKSILQLPKKRLPDAVVAVNDPAAFGAMQAIYQSGRMIPDDIAIVGFSNEIRSPYAQTPLTTVDQIPYEVGKRAAAKLLRHIDHSEEPIEKIILPTKLVIRRSCGCNLDT